MDVIRPAAEPTPPDSRPLASVLDGIDEVLDSLRLAAVLHRISARTVGA